MVEMGGAAHNLYMKSKQLKVLRQAAKILKKDPISKGCKTYCYGCWQCMMANLSQEFISFVEDWLKSDEEIALYFKRFEKKKQKSSTKV